MLAAHMTILSSPQLDVLDGSCGEARRLSKFLLPNICVGLDADVGQTTELFAQLTGYRSRHRNQMGEPFLRYPSHASLVKPNSLRAANRNPCSYAKFVRLKYWLMS